MLMNDVGTDFKKKFVLASSEGHLYLTLLPTEKCNFRCTYCYEDFELGKMSDDTIHGIKNLLNKAAPTLKNLMISWFGGEPTLNKKAIVEISEHIVELQKQYGFKYSSHMTTNAYLIDRDMMEQFVSLGINDFQITLDGDKETHDTTRVQINGKGSFDVIWGNLLSYRDIDANFTVMLRLHVTDQNREAMFRLCKMIKTEFDGDPRYTTCIEQIRNLGDGVDSSDAKQYLPDNAKDRVTEMKELMDDVMDERIKSGDRGNPYICYAAMPRQILIRSDGTVGKCTVMLTDPRNHLGKLDRDGNYDLDGEKYELWTRGFVSLDKMEISCPARDFPALSQKPAKFESDIEIVQVA